MKENFNIENEFDQLFKEQLSQHSSPVPSTVWSNVSGGLAKKALFKSILIKTIVVTTVVAGSVAVYLSLKNDENIQISNTEINNITENNTPLSNIEHTDFNKKNAMEIVSENKINLGPIRVKSNRTQLPLPSIIDDETVTIQDDPNPVYLNPNIPLEHKKIEIRKQENNVSLKEENKQEKDETNINTYIPNLQDTFNIPNIFTPNGDGVNDNYIVQIGNLETFEMIIFDMMFNRIFETKNKNSGWNGYLSNGEEAPEGQYIVKIIYKYKNNNETKTKQNTILLNK